MRLWVITDGIQDNNDVVAVCSSEEKAEIVRKYVDGDSLEIEVDEFVDYITAGLHWFTGYVYEDERYGVDMRRSTPGYGSVGYEIKLGEKYDRMVIGLWAKNKQEADRIATDKRTAWLAAKSPPAPEPSA